MALPREIQDLLDHLSEADLCEIDSPSLSPYALIETACQWLSLAIKGAETNPQSVSRVYGQDTANRLRFLADQFESLKK